MHLTNKTRSKNTYVTASHLKFRYSSHDIFSCCIHNSRYYYWIQITCQHHATNANIKLVLYRINKTTGYIFHLLWEWQSNQILSILLKYMSLPSRSSGSLQGLSWARPYQSLCLHLPLLPWKNFLCCSQINY